jgi:hypothetical protein
MYTHSDLVQNYNDALAVHHGKGAAVSLQSALQCGLWYNTTANSEQQHIEQPQAVLAHWQGMDNRTRYEQHIENNTTRRQLKRYGWLNSTIDYHINSWGFRCDREYVSIDEPCLVVLGCSFTYGTGLHEHQTWGRVLADRLGLRLVNLAVPGHGLDLGSFWLLLEGHQITNPVAVCVLEPPPGRVSWIRSINNTVTMADTMLNLATNNPRITNTLLLNSSISSLRNYHTIRSWAAERNCEMLWSKRYAPPTTLARDLAHYGPEWQLAIAEEFYNHLKNT